MQRRCVLLLVLLWGWAAVGAETCSAAKVNAFVSVLPQAYFVERVGGDLVDVSVMVGPGQSPATYELTPKQMHKLSEADLYFSIGVPFEKVWLNRITASNPSMRVVDTLAGVPLRSMEAHAHEAEGEAEGQSRGVPGLKDPHVWLSPRRVKIQAGNICEALAEFDPEHAGVYRVNLEAFQSDLDQVNREISQLLAPLRGRRFMVFHPSWGYFAEDYGLIQVPIEIEGKTPGTRALAALIDEAKEERIKVIFVQKQFSAATARTISEAIGGKVVAMDPLDPDYLNNLLRIARTLAEGLQ